jgi:hypothetical protein
MGSILNVYKIHHKDIYGFLQHLEAPACVGNNTLVFPPQLRLRCVKKYKINPEGEEGGEVD